MAVACSVTENNLDAFQFEDLKEEKLQAMIPGTITGEKGMEKLQAMIPGTITDEKSTEKLQAMIPGTITDEKGTEKLQAMIPGTITSTITDKRHKNMGNQMFSRF